ncbi:MAG: helix-turn-helix transcriptional regulator [Spirochaetes bacterium]|nr:helix-turn-helix transcriptional regulator [Spirochaetota bacterium]
MKQNEIVYRIPEIWRGVPFLPTAVGFSPAQAHFFQRDRPYRTSIECLVSGSADLVVDRMPFELRPGDVFLLPRFSTFRYEARPPAFASKFYLYFERESIELLLSLFRLEGIFHVPAGATLLPLFRSAHALAEGLSAADPRAPFPRQGKDLAHLVHRVLHTLAEGAGTLFVRHSPLVQRLKDFLDARFHETIPLGRLGQLVGTTSTYVIRRFKAELGATPHHYLLARRFEAASFLLSHGELPVSEIAQRCGFGDGRYFATQFKKQTGRTPTAFREGNREGASALSASGTVLPRFTGR